MSRLAPVLICGLLIGLSSGCRNNCYQGCGLFRGNSRIAPPGTYSLQIPGSANQNYYTPAQQPNTTNQGWNAPPGTANNVQPGGNPTSYSIAAGNGMAPNMQQVSSSTMPGSGSRIISPDFASTRIDERQDPSRVQLADASQARNQQPWTQIPNSNQSNQLASASMPVMSNPGYSMPNAVQNSGFNNAVPVNQWTWSPNSPAQQQKPQWVLAEASTRDLSRDANFQAGWRDSNTIPNQGTINR